MLFMPLRFSVISIFFLVPHTPQTSSILQSNKSDVTSECQPDNVIDRSDNASAPRDARVCYLASLHRNV